MATHFPLMVPSASPEGDPAMIVSPFDRTPIATVDRVGLTGIERALATAHGLFRDRNAWLPPTRRIEILRRAAVLMRERRNELALEAAREGGKPLRDSLVETDRAIDGLNGCVEVLRTRAGGQIPMDLDAASAGRLAFTLREPVGVVLAFSAFNHPLNLIVHQVAPAVATGCPVIVKPAEATPLSCFRFVSLLREAGLPDAWCQALLTNDLETAGRLAADRRVGFFTFIGSARVGWMLRARLASGTRCSLEHGGAAPTIVAADANLDQALPALARGGFYHAGQVCVSVQRVFAHESIASRVADDLAGLANALVVGDPTSPETEVGPLIRPAEVERVHEWVRNALAAGAGLCCGGKPLSSTCYVPTVLFDPPADAEVSTREIFGPVVCVYPFTEIDDAIRRANSLPFAFQASVFARDLDTCLRASRRLDASAVMVNDHTAFRVDWMPFAGLRESGLGTGGIPFTMDDMEVEKMVVVRSAEL